MNSEGILKDTYEYYMCYTLRFVGNIGIDLGIDYRDRLKEPRDRLKEPRDRLKEPRDIGI